MVYKVAKIKGKEYLIKYSDSKDKKYEVEVDGKKIRFAQVGYRMFPGQKRGQNYCTRSYGIVDKSGKPTRGDIKSPNFWSRLLWGCKGKRSRKI
jgi:hypothetical protein